MACVESWKDYEFVDETVARLLGNACGLDGGGGAAAGDALLAGVEGGVFELVVEGRPPCAFAARPTLYLRLQSN